jgi:uncharacterized protein with HEPN domain
MMQPTSFKLLRDVLAAADSISRATAGLTFQDYQRIELLQAGVERWFEKIGEALRRLERADPDTAAKIPGLRDVVDFRNLLAHGYDMVRDDYVWRYAAEYLPELSARIAALLEENVDRLTIDEDDA